MTTANLKRLVRIAAFRTPEDLVNLADEADRAGLPDLADKLDFELANTVAPSRPRISVGDRVRPRSDNRSQPLLGTVKHENVDPKRRMIWPWMVHWDDGYLEEESGAELVRVDNEEEADADDPKGLSDMPTPALEDIPTEIGPASKPEPLPLSTREPLGRTPTIDDVMEAIKEQKPIEASDLQSMDKKDLELLRARLGLVMNTVEKALGYEATPLLSPEEQERHEESETMRGTFSRPGAASFPLSKRGMEEEVAS